MSPTSDVTVPRATRRHALLIGIDAYSKRHVKAAPLEGCVNDVQRLAQALWRRGDSVRLLLDERAGRDEILEALTRLESEAETGDEVLFCYAGYGSWVRAPTWPTTFATLVPHDGTRQRGKPLRDLFILEVDRWAERLIGRGVVVRKLYDAAFDAGAGEAYGTGPSAGRRRFVRPDERPVERLTGQEKNQADPGDLPPAWLEVLGRDEPVAAADAPVTRRGEGQDTALSAIGADPCEEPIETGDFEGDVRVHGLASWALVRQLEETMSAGSPTEDAGEAPEGEASRDTPREPKKHALLIGINRYPNIAERDGRDLEGCLNDVQQMIELLSPRGFEIRLLLNAYATREGIRDAFEVLVGQRVGPGDTVVVYFSGHGSTLRDEGRTYQTLVPSDSGRGEAPNCDLLDVEIGLWLARLSLRTPNVTLIVDSCYSGGLGRGGETGSETRRTRRTRSLPGDDRLPIARDELGELERQAAETSGPTSRSATGWPWGPLRRGTLLAACGADEKAVEWRGPRTGGRTHGVFTYTLAEVLGRHATVPWPDLDWPRLLEHELVPAMRDGEPRPVLDDGTPSPDEPLPELERHALVIGINDYGNGLRPLRTARADAEALAELLPRLGWGPDKITLLTDGDGETVEGSELLAALRSLRTVPEESALIFYFAGHGEATGDDGMGFEGYLLAQDAAAGERQSWLAMDVLRHELAELPCRHLLVVLDCCFAGAFSWSHRSGGRRRPLYRGQYRRYVEREVRQLLTSAAHDQLARDVGARRLGDGRLHSPFAIALLEGLAGKADFVGDGIVTAGELYLHVEQSLAREGEEKGQGGGPRQTPGLSYLRNEHIGRQFVFLRPGVRHRLRDDPVLDAERLPWRGPTPYGEAHAELFFGREHEVKTLAARLEATGPPLLQVLVGSSGSGKSSLLRAGLLAQLRASETPWQIADVPRLGRSPAQTIREAVAENITYGPEDSEKMRRLVVIDPFEDLHAVAVPSVERRAVYRLLRELLGEGVRVLVTLGSHLEHRVMGSWGTVAEVTRLSRPSLEALRQIIEGPAEAVALFFEPGLVETMLEELREARWPLPMLSAALAAMFEHAHPRLISGEGGRQLTLEDYFAVGGVDGVIRKQALLLLRRAEADDRPSLRRLLFRLVSIEGGLPTRRRVEAAELELDDAEQQHHLDFLVSQMVERRVLVEDGGSIEVANNALLVGLPQVHRWLESSEVRAWLELHHQAWDDARYWYENPSRPRLWAKADPRLDRLATRRDDLNRIERSFLAAGLRRRQLWRVGRGLLTGLFVAGLLLLTYTSMKPDASDEPSAVNAETRRLDSSPPEAPSPPPAEPTDPKD